MTVYQYKRRGRKDKAEGGSKAPGADYSDDVLALLFAHHHKDDLRYCEGLGGYLAFDGGRWTADELGAEQRARTLLRGQKAAARMEGLPHKAIERLTSRQKMRDVLGMARNDEQLRAAAEDFDRDQMGLCTPGGFVDLRTGAMRKNRPEDLCTKITAVAPAAAGAPCPMWMAFLKRVTAGDADQVRYLQRLAGYCASGDTSEQALYFNFGSGRNGKGVFVNTLAGILGNYAKEASMDTFTATKYPQHTTELAGLAGRRLVTARETQRGRNWAEAKIKAVTGGDPITARFMRQDDFTYIPRFKLLVSGNFKPMLSAVDEAIRARFHVIPWEVTIPEEERISNLDERLRAEWPAILRWMIDGCLDWQENRLRRTKKIADATAHYLEGQDAIARWIDECCERDAQAWTASGELYASWKSWAEAQGERIGSMRLFADALEGQGFKGRRTYKGRGFDGIGLTGGAARGDL